MALALGVLGHATGCDRGRRLGGRRTLDELALRVFAGRGQGRRTCNQRDRREGEHGCTDHSISPGAERFGTGKLCLTIDARNR